jgi:hypothetical protein
MVQMTMESQTQAMKKTVTITWDIQDFEFCVVNRDILHMEMI